MGRFIPEKFEIIALNCVPPSPVIHIFARSYHNGDVQRQYKFMLDAIKIIQEACKETSDRTISLNTWGMLNSFFREKLLKTYAKSRISASIPIEIEIVPSASDYGTDFELSSNNSRVIANFITSTKLHATKDIGITIEQFVERCKKYFDIQLPTRIPLPYSMQPIIACIKTDQNNQKIKRHCMAMMPEYVFAGFCDSLLEIIYNAQETREKKIDAIFALVFLYGSKPHAIFYTDKENKQCFAGGAFATDFLLQYLLASIGEKPIRKNYLTLTEIELLFCFAQDNETAWHTPRQCYLDAVNGQPCNLFFHQGDALSLLQMLVSEECDLMKFAQTQAEKNDYVFHTLFLKILCALLKEYQPDYKPHYLSLLSASEPEASATQKIQQLCNLIRSLEPEPSENFFADRQRFVDVLRTQLSAIEPQSMIHKLLERLCEMATQAACREELFFQLQLVFPIMHNRLSQCIESVIHPPALFAGFLNRENNTPKPDFIPLKDDFVSPTNETFAEDNSDTELLSEVQSVSSDDRLEELEELEEGITLNFQINVAKKNLELQDAIAEDLKKHTFILRDETGRSITCMRLFYSEHAVIVKKNEADANAYDDIRLLEITDAPFIAHDANIFLQKIDGNLLLFPKTMLPVFIEALKIKYSARLLIALMNAGISCEQDQAISDILKTHELDLNNDDTLLHIATRTGYVKITETLLKKGADANQINDIKRTPLFIAAQQGHEKVVEVLLENGANVNQPDRINSTPLLIAVQNQHAGVVKALLAKGADANRENKNNSLPLQMAVRNGDTKIVEMLLASGANINTLTFGVSLLYSAVKNKRVDIIKILLENGANIDQQNYAGATPLYIAAQQGDIEVVKALLENNANVNQQENNGTTPLFIAAQQGYIEIVKALLEKHAYINQSQNDGITPLFIAAQQGNFEILNVLLENGANVNQPDRINSTPLFIAAQKGHLTIVQALLAKINKDHHSPNFFIPSRYEDSIVSPITAKISILRDALKDNKDAALKFENLLREKNISGETIPHFSTLHIAIIFNHKEIAEELKKSMSVREFNQGAQITTAELEEIFKPSPPVEIGHVI